MKSLVDSKREKKKKNEVFVFLVHANIHLLLDYIDFVGSFKYFYRCLIFTFLTKTNLLIKSPLYFIIPKQN